MRIHARLAVVSVLALSGLACEVRIEGDIDKITDRFEKEIDQLADQIDRLGNHLDAAMNSNAGDMKKFEALAKELETALEDSIEEIVRFQAEVSDKDSLTRRKIDKGSAELEKRLQRIENQIRKWEQRMTPEVKAGVEELQKTLKRIEEEIKDKVRT